MQHEESAECWLDAMLMPLFVISVDWRALGYMQQSMATWAKNVLFCWMYKHQSIGMRILCPRKHLTRASAHLSASAISSTSPKPVAM